MKKKKKKKKKVLLSGSDPFYLSKNLRRRRYGEVSAQTFQKSQNRVVKKIKVAYRAPAAQAAPTTNAVPFYGNIFLEMLRTVASPGTFGCHDRCLLIRRLTHTTACGRPPKSTMYSLVREKEQMSLIRRNSDRAWGTCVSPPEATRRSFVGVFARSAKIFFWTINRTFSKPKILAAGLNNLSKKKRKRK